MTYDAWTSVSFAQSAPESLSQLQFCTASSPFSARYNGLKGQTWLFCRPYVTQVSRDRISGAQIACWQYAKIHLQQRFALWLHKSYARIVGNANCHWTANTTCDCHYRWSVGAFRPSRRADVLAAYARRVHLYAFPGAILHTLRSGSASRVDTLPPVWCADRIEIIAIQRRPYLAPKTAG